MADFPKLLTSRYELNESWLLSTVEKHGAYEVARKALTTMKPEEIAAEVKEANIRGRGGAGFPAGVKWGFIPKGNTKPVYLAVNGDEGEPGTFKDRTIMERDPHRLIEGCVITLFAIGGHIAYIYVRCELVKAIRRLEDAIEEARQKGFIGDRPFGKDHKIEIYVQPGAGAYICGEESSLLNSLEGNRGEPRLRPPFPAVEGAFRCPTIVNNVETISSISEIVRMGGKAWSDLSRLPRDGGVRIYGVSGHVKNPGIYEAPVGISMRELVYDLGGGMLYENRPLKAVIPGGSSTPVLRADDVVNAPGENDPLHAWQGKSHLDVPMGADTYRALGTMLGTCCATVMDNSVNMVEVARNLIHFYAHESCGQCTPCREGSAWMRDILDNLCRGKGRKEDVRLLVEIANNIMGNTICAFGDGMSMPMLGLVQKFYDEFLEAAKNGVPGSPLGDSAKELMLGSGA
ncbi:MAG: NADH-quinone oxidoreductase subunit NuoF [Deltaproteobacteria bacterium]|nr:NADH-quinone oxidoreductase subunit NuoF [Deltaproteobacteria bacterium]